MLPTILQVIHDRDPTPDNNEATMAAVPVGGSVLVPAATSDGVPQERSDK